MLSARNQFAGKVTAVAEGSVNGIVSLDVNGTTVTGTISMESIKALGLAAGKEATAFIKATEVMVGTGDLKLSARNQFAGKVASVEKGAVNSIVKIDAPVGGITATISNESVEALGLAAGKDAVAVIKATSVMFGA
jgi:molybdate transport system regulatory protein